MKIVFFIRLGLYGTKYYSRWLTIGNRWASYESSTRVYRHKFMNVDIFPLPFLLSPAIVKNIAALIFIYYLCAQPIWAIFKQVRHSKYMEIMEKDPPHLLLLALLSIANSCAILLDFISLLLIHSIHLCVHCMFSLIFSLLCESYYYCAFFCIPYHFVSMDQQNWL